MADQNQQPPQAPQTAPTQGAPQQPPPTPTTDVDKWQNLVLEEYNQRLAALELAYDQLVNKREEQHKAQEAVYETLAEQMKAQRLARMKKYGITQAQIDEHLAKKKAQTPAPLAGNQGGGTQPPPQPALQAPQAPQPTPQTPPAPPVQAPPQQAPAPAPPQVPAGNQAGGGRF